MKTKSSILVSLITIFAFTSISLVAQQSDLLPSNIVFIDSINIRDKPSLKSNVVGQLSQNYKISIANDKKLVPDVIGKKEGYWVPILYNNAVNYIWSGVLSEKPINSKLDNNETILANLSSSGILSLKVFKSNDLIEEVKYVVGNDTCKIISVNSLEIDKRKDEVISVFFDNGKYELIYWNGKELYADKLGTPNEVEYLRFFNEKDEVLRNRRGISYIELHKEASEYYTHLKSILNDIFKDYRLYSSDYKAISNDFYIEEADAYEGVAGIGSYNSFIITTRYLFFENIKNNINIYNLSLDNFGGIFYSATSQYFWSDIKFIKKYKLKDGIIAYGALGSVNMDSPTPLGLERLMIIVFDGNYVYLTKKKIDSRTEILKDCMAIFDQTKDMAEYRECEITKIKDRKDLDKINKELDEMINDYFKTFKSK